MAKSFGSMMAYTVIIKMMPIKALLELVANIIRIIDNIPKYLIKVFFAIIKKKGKTISINSAKLLGFQ